MQPLLAALLIAAAAHAQGCSIFPGLMFDAGLRPDSVVTADFDGNGTPDLAMTNADGVVVLAGDGAGSFAPPASVNLPTGELVTGDFDGDGKPDLAVTSKTSDTVSVLLGNVLLGGTPTSYFIGSHPYGVALAAGDLDGDGVLDLAAMNESGFGTETISVIFGDGLGGFSAPLSFAVGEYLGSLVIADLNGDGHADLVYGTQDPEEFSTIAAIYGDGHGGFAAPTTVATLASVGLLRVADLNGDAVSDLVAVDLGLQTRGDVFVALGDGHGGFAPFTKVFTAGWATTDVAIDDLDGDLDPDLIITTAIPASAAFVCLGDGLGGFAAPRSFAAGPDPLSTTTCDADQDGHRDVVVTNGYAVAVLFGDGTGSLEQIPFIGAGPRPEAVVASDLNADATPDLVTICDRAMAVLLGNRSATGYSAPMVINLAETPAWIGVADVDHDARPDVVTSSGFAVAVLLGDGRGGFAAPARFPVGNGAAAAALADLDDDGNVDLAVANPGTGSVSILLGDGHGGFSAATVFPCGSSPSAVVAADLNGDGNQDLAVTNRLVHTVSILLGDGQGGMSSPKAFRTGTAPDSVSAADMNGDGALDLVTGGTDGVTVLLKQPSAGFPAHTTYGARLPHQGVAVGDVNGDGHIDVAAVAPGIGAAMFFGDGLGGFADSRAILAGWPWSVTLADVTSDGKQDLLVVDSSYGVATLLSGCPAASVLSYGTGCAGSGGFVPTLAMTCCPHPGQTVIVTIANALGGSLAPLFVGLTQASMPLPAAGSCTLLIAPPLPFLTVPLAGFGAGNGFQDLALTLPQGLSPGVVTMQAYVLDAGVPQGYSNTNGLEMHIE